MSAGKTSQGKHGRQGEETNRLSHDAVKLLKSQDAGYLRAVAGQGRRELERLEQAVGLESVLLGSGRRQVAKKVVFVDGEESGEQEKRGRKRKVEEMDQEQDGMNVMGTNANANSVVLDGPEFHNEDQTSAATPTKAKSKKTLQAGQQVKLDLRAARRRRKRLGELRAAKLEALRKRQKEIMVAAGQLELQRAKMSRTVGGVNKDGVKWKIRERKK
jgi:U3 small nucleolar RNA-associated protein 11